MNTTTIAFYESPIGTMKIAATDRSICEILFVDEIETASQSYQSPLLIQAITELTEYFSGKRLLFSLPFYQNGTHFQTKVWKELLNISYGTTINYLTLAKRLGDAKAIRAAASTNGKNQLSIVVPCHRVIGTNGNLVGYAGGLWRKQWLLEHENKFANGVQTLF